MYKTHGYFTRLLRSASAGLALLTIAAMPASAQYNLIAPTQTFNNTLQTGGVTFSDMNRLNCETMEIAATGDIMTATVWEGVTTGGSPVLGLNVGIQGIPNPAVVTLPGGSTFPDVTIGYDGDDYFVVVAYVNTLEIFAQIYRISWTTTTVTATPTVTSAISGAPLPLQDYDRPTIDIYAQGSAPYHFVNFVVAYEEQDASGFWNALTCAGDIYGSVGTPVTHSTGEAVPPWADVACIYNPSGNDEYWLAFHTETGGGEEITLMGYSGTTPTPIYSNIIATSGAITPTHMLPRIGAQTVYDLATPSCEPLLTVAYQSIVSPNIDVNRYTLYPAACSTPAVTTPTISFTAYDPNAKLIMPCITMPGTFLGSTANLGNLMANIGFYSRDKEAGPYTGNGEYMAVGVDYGLANFIGMPDVWGINTGGLNNNFDFSPGNPLPYMAISSAHNTGKDLYSVWYTGSAGPGGTIEYKFAGNGTSPMFKTSITNINKQKEYNLFPNPATDYISVSGVTDADYKVMDMTGRLVGQGTLSVGGNPVTISALPVGNYLLLITEDGLTQQFKFTKQ